MAMRDRAAVEVLIFDDDDRRAARDVGKRKLLIRRSGIALLAGQRASGNLRKQCGERLRFRLEGGEAIRFGLAQLRIVLQGALIDRYQIGRRNGMKAQETRNQRQ